nr:6997_t:CDS:2 [Entrophospora candida]
MNNGRGSHGNLGRDREKGDNKRYMEEIRKKEEEERKKLEEEERKKLEEKNKNKRET